MSMSRKDYEAISAVFFEQVEHDSEGHNVGCLSDEQLDAKWQATRQVAGCLALYFASENPRFDRDRFLTACGVS